MGAATVAAAAAATMIASKTTRAADEYVFSGGAARIAAGALEVAYYQIGDPDAIPVLLLHGWPYDIHSYVEVAPRLAERGCRVIVT
jgi:hypothetical protein